MCHRERAGVLGQTVDYERRSLARCDGVGGVDLVAAVAASELGDTGPGAAYMQAGSDLLVRHWTGQMLDDKVRPGIEGGEGAVEVVELGPSALVDADSVTAAEVFAVVSCTERSLLTVLHLDELVQHADGRVTPATAPDGCRDEKEKACAAATAPAERAAISPVAHVDAAGW